jgi:hypothetical protein
MEDPMTKTVTVRFRDYHFDTPAKLAPIEQECKERGIRAFEALDVMKGPRPKEGVEYLVELGNGVHDNQFSTKDGLHCFDWRDYYIVDHYGNRSPRRFGYVIEPGPGFDAIQEHRRETVKCGYCGAREPRTHGMEQWCIKCTGSEYLTLENLPLLLMLPLTGEQEVSLDNVVPSLVTETYHKAQDIRTGALGVSKIRKARAALDKRLKDCKEKVQIEKALLDVLESSQADWRLIENSIFYEHIHTVSFGWRTVLTPEQTEQVQGMIPLFNQHPHLKHLKIQITKPRVY